MVTKLKVLILCGCGGATSSLVGAKVKQLLESAGYAAEISTAMVTDARTRISTFHPDFIVSNTPVSVEEVPVFNGVSFLTGIGVEKVKEEILKLTREKKQA